MKKNEQRLFYEKLKKEELIDIILEFEDSDKKDAEIYEYQNSKIKKLQKENEELKQQLAEQVKTVNIERIETFDNRKRWKSNDSR